MNIDRTLFWFKDGDDSLHELDDNFFALGTLLNRLLNQKYEGKKIKFINLNLSTDQTYELHPMVPKDKPYYYGGHLQYYGTFDRKYFEALTRTEQNRYVWDKGLDYLCKSAAFIKNQKLAEAAEYAYRKGLEINLNPDYRLVETDFFLSGQKLKAAVWLNFKDDGMYSKFTLEKAGTVIYEREIDQTKKGIEFFLEIYKKIEVENNNIIIKGVKDVEYLPLKISLNDILSQVKEIDTI